MKRLVEEDVTRVISGQLPEKIEGTPRTSYLHFDRREIKNVQRERVAVLEERLRLVLNELEELKKDRTKKRGN